MPRPALALLLALGTVLPAWGLAPREDKDDPKSNNKDKILGKWQVTSLPKNAQGGKDDLGELKKLGVYVYFDFKAGGVLTIGLGSDDEKTLEALKSNAPGMKITWNGKYRLLAGDEIEFLELPKEFQGPGGKQESKGTAKISNDEMKITDKDGTATFKKLKK